MKSRPFNEAERKEYKETGEVKSIDFDLFDAPIISEYEYDDSNYGYFSVALIELGKGSVYNGIICLDESVYYRVEVTLANVCYNQNNKTFDNLVDAIDYYNKIKDFIKSRRNV